jgi:hypothetical protein
LFGCAFAILDLACQDIDHQLGELVRVAGAPSLSLRSLRQRRLNRADRLAKTSLFGYWSCDEKSVSLSNRFRIFSASGA